MSMRRLAVAVAVALVGLAALMAPVTCQQQCCVFNTMCSCRPGGPARHYYALYTSSRDEHTPPAHYIDQVICLGVPLSKLPDLPRGPIAQVDIANSGLVTVESEPLAGTRVESLRLMGNSIKHIDERAFSSMSGSLISLDLAYNDLDAIPFAAIHDLRNLQWLNLHGNGIRSLQGDWSHMHGTLTSLLVGDNDISSLSSKTSELQEDSHLNKFQTLTTLNLDGNKLSHLGRHALPATLQTLRLSHNLLKEFPADVIEHLHQLQWLYLRGNYLPKLPPHTFRRFVKFEKLDFGENDLKVLPKHLFNHTMLIRDLSLEFNKIEYLHPETFLGLKTGRILLNYNHINGMHSRAFMGVENTLEYLDLQNNKLTSVPNALTRLTGLKYLYLASNAITEIPENIFSSFCDGLRALSLSGNLLTSIPSQALANCSKLSHLNVGYNQITELKEDDLQEWASNLDTLLLRSNRISTLEENSFNMTYNLRELSLSFNPLNFIHPNIFKYVSKTLESIEISFGLSEENFPLGLLQPLTRLIWLALDNNNLKSFHVSYLNSFHYLQYLNLEYNKIKYIEPNDNFTTDCNLTVFRLSHNDLTSVESKTFTSFPKLQSISLSGNKITILKSKAFANLTGLTKLTLADNEIVTIEPGAFTNLPILQKLDLHQNKLTNFPMNAFINTTDLKFPLLLNLSSNHLNEIQPSNAVLNIKTLDLKHNEFKYPPKRFLEKISGTIKSLYLEFNSIMELELEAFGPLTSLEDLTLKHNKISSIIKHSFLGLDSLQVLDLSHNHIDRINVGQFSYLQSLRIIDLNSNKLHYLPKECFRNTKLEKLDVSNNQFTVMPTTVLTDIGLTLRDLRVSRNNIEHIDSTMFPTTPFLLNLDLSHNRLNILPDNVFANLDHLQQLDLSSNPLRANFKELFHYAQSLKQLNLANIGLKSMPTLPLPNLVHLNLSSNIIEDMSRYSMKSLARLKHLYLNDNNFTVVPSNHWGHLKALSVLDLGNNPIKEITARSFQGLNELQSLRLDGLPLLEAFDTDSLSHLKILTSVTIQTWSRFKKTKFYLEHILSNVTSLRKLSVDIQEIFLTDQLHGVLSNRIKELSIRGRNLRAIDVNAFHGLENNAELLIKITGTQIEELPIGLIANFHRVPHLRLDLQSNSLTSLTPDVFYTNMTSWDSFGTRIVAGGLVLKDNPWVCDCRLVWLGHWLRRWLRESLQVHTMDVDTAQRAWAELADAQCRDPDTGTVTAIISLYPEDMSCHASALSNSGSWTYGSHQIFYRLLIVIFIYIR